MGAPLYVQAKKTTLFLPISDGEVNEIRLTRLVDIYGNQLTIDDLRDVAGDKVWMVLNPGGENEEIIEFTGMTVNADGTVSIDEGIARGRAAKAPYTSGGTARSHGAGTVVVLSNTPQMYNILKEYIDDASVAGAVNASEVAKGIVEEATVTEINDDEETGATGAKLFATPADLAASKYGLQLPSADEKAALAGNSGTPGVSNVFVTQEGAAKAIGFGGDGSDGALSISSGTTTIDLGAASVVVKNYTSISITDTGKLAFSNPHANGTIVILRAQGNVDLTSSQAPMIDLRGIGAAGGLSATSTTARSGWYIGGSFPAYSTAPFPTGMSLPAAVLAMRFLPLAPGSGGNLSGGGVDGGRGAGALLIECGGAWNFTTAGGISVAGNPGENDSSGPGAGGGGAGTFLGLYKTLTANSGTVTTTGGPGGTGTSGTGGTAGASLVNNGAVGSGTTGGEGGEGLSLVADVDNYGII